MTKNELLNHLWDIYYGIQTEYQVLVGELKTTSENLVNAKRYQGSHYYLLRSIFKEFDNLEDYTLIDYGSGKGRVLVVALQYGVKKAVGIEFAKNLFLTSEKNLSKFSKRFKKNNYHLIHDDVVNYKVTTQKNIHFFFNPFNAVVMRQVLENIKQNPMHKGDYIISINPRTAFEVISRNIKLIKKIKSDNPNRIVHVYKL